MWRDSPLAWLGGAAVAGVCALFASRALVRPAGETLELVGVAADTAVVWATLTVDDAGLLARQLTTELLVLQPGGEPLRHRAAHGPTSAPGEDGVSAGPDRLGPVDGGWELRVGGGNLGARVQARGATRTCPPDAGSMTGFVEDHVDGRLLAGAAVVVATRSERTSPMLYVIGPSFAAGVDPAAECPAWVRTPDGAWTGAAPAVEVARRAELTLGAWTLRLRHLGDPVTRPGDAHLLLPERLLARLGGFLPAAGVARRVTMWVSGPGVDGIRAGLLVERP